MRPLKVAPSAGSAPLYPPSGPDCTLEEIRKHSGQPGTYGADNHCRLNRMATAKRKHIGKYREKQKLWLKKMATSISNKGISLQLFVNFVQISFNTLLNAFKSHYEEDSVYSQNMGWGYGRRWGAFSSFGELDDWCKWLCKWEKFKVTFWRSSIAADTRDSRTCKDEHSIACSIMKTQGHGCVSIVWGN